VPDFQLTLPTAAIIGMMIYGGCALFKKKGRIGYADIAPFVIAGVSGMGVISGVHLCRCAYAPECLLHITKKDGTPIDINSLSLSISDMHSGEIAIAGLIMSIVSIVVLAESVGKLLCPLRNSFRFLAMNAWGN
jgi:hypothetical protein